MPSASVPSSVRFARLATTFVASSAIRTPPMSAARPVNDASIFSWSPAAVRAGRSVNVPCVVSAATSACASMSSRERTAPSKDSAVFAVMSTTARRSASGSCARKRTGRASEATCPRICAWIASAPGWQRTTTSSALEEKRRRAEASIASQPVSFRIAASTLTGITSVSPSAWTTTWPPRLRRSSVTGRSTRRFSEKGSGGSSDAANKFAAGTEKTPFVATTWRTTPPRVAESTCPARRRSGR